MIRSERPVFRHIGQPAGGIRLKKRQIDMQRIRFLPLHQGGADLRESRAVGQRQLLYMAAHRRDIAGDAPSAVTASRSASQLRPTVQKFCSVRAPLIGCSW